jgi:hypothetical protein
VNEYSSIIHRPIASASLIGELMSIYHIIAEVYGCIVIVSTQWVRQIISWFPNVICKEKILLKIECFIPKPIQIKELVERIQVELSR